jgi:hypothetical protein
MNILSAHRGNDTGGTGYRISHAFRKGGEDVPWDWEQIQELYRDSDVFHARNDWSTYERLAGLRNPRPRLIHYHGTNFRVLNAKRLREQGDNLALVSTLDLWLIAPDRLEWLPSPYDLESLHDLRS